MQCKDAVNTININKINNCMSRFITNLAIKRNNDIMMSWWRESYSTCRHRRKLKSWYVGQDSSTWWHHIDTRQPVIDETTQISNNMCCPGLTVIAWSRISHVQTLWQSVTCGVGPILLYSSYLEWVCEPLSHCVICRRCCERSWKSERVKYRSLSARYRFVRVAVESRGALGE